MMIDKMKKHIYKNITTASMEAVEDFWGRRQIAMYSFCTVSYSLEHRKRRKGKSLIIETTVSTLLNLWYKISVLLSDL
jgi:hypothetical protein